MAFWTKYRSILTQDIVHVQRPDMQSVDALVHVTANKSEPIAALAVLYNPTEQQQQATAKLPLYFTGEGEGVMVAQEEQGFARAKLQQDAGGKYALLLGDFLDLPLAPGSIDTVLLQPIAAAANALPLLALRPGLDAMAQLLERGPQLLRHLPAMRHLSGAFGPLVDRHLQDPFLRHWVDLLCFLISGMPMGDTNAAAMATLFGDWFDPEASLDYPVGGSAAVVDALVQGLQRHGGSLRTQARVEQILVEDGRACGVRLADGDCIRADQVVSNADIWSTLALLPDGVASSWSSDRAATPACRGFLHLHLGFDASGLDDLPIHTVWVDDWERGIAADRNAVVLSVPSVLDPGMAPPGRHVLHAYTPASEPWEFWRDLERGSDAYNARKQDRCGVFWSVLERKIPDIRQRCELVMEGTPLTHRDFLNVHQGSYGPALSAADGLFPGVTTPIDALWLCGASTFPGIGIPPVAASGALAAHGIVGRQAQRSLLKDLEL